MMLSRHFWFALVIMCIISSFGIALAQVASEIPAGDFAANAPPAVDRSDISTNVSLLSAREFVLSLAILIFGVIIVGVQYLMLRPAVETKTDRIAETNIVTLIIIGTLVLISSGFSTEDIAPAIGLFGTIAGYLLGKQANKGADK